MLIGFLAGLAYALMALLIVRIAHRNVSNAFIFIVPVVLGAIPVLFSSKEGLRYYRDFLLLPLITVFTFFLVCLVFHFDGTICLTIIVTPFVLLGFFAAFLTRMARLKAAGNGTPLYAMLLLPFLVLMAESGMRPDTRFGNVITSIEIKSSRAEIWDNIKNVRDIRPGEVQNHFIHFIGIPKPLDGRLDKEGIGVIRQITWEKRIRFKENINSWEEGKKFTYNIEVDASSVPPGTLDDHVMIGGDYFGVTTGGYRIDSIAPKKFALTLNCGYRVSTSLNWYGEMWADFLLNQFNHSILEVIKKRSEALNRFRTN